MNNDYDAVIVGAGPAGLMAAKKAAESGLKVVIIEKRRDVTKITRACSQLFILDEGYEKESIKVKEGKIIFPSNGFEVEYSGPTYKVTDSYHLSPHGHKVHFANKDRSPFAIKFDKGILLKDLREQCERAGVELRGCTVAYDAKDSGQGVEVGLTCKGAKSTLRAKRIIIADGVNSRIAETLGMNQGRTLFGVAPAIIYLLEGLKDFTWTAWKYYHMGYPSKITVIIEPSLMGENVAEIVIQGSKVRPPDKIYHEISTQGPLSYMFEQANLVDKVGCSVKVLTSMKVPYKGNALVIGDAAACPEVEVQGALMCGFHAANAVIKEMKGQSGFQEYTKWWQDAMEFNRDEELRWAASTFSAANVYKDEELDYLFSLTEDEVLEGSYSQWRQPRLMWKSILRHRERIAKERPEIYEKINKFNSIAFKELWTYEAPK